MGRTVHRPGRPVRLVLVVAMAAAAVVVLILTGGRSRLDDVRDATGLADCERVRPSRDPRVGRWRATVETETDACPGVGPLFTYARFGSARTLRSALLRHPPPAGVCLVGATEVLMTDLLDGTDTAACHRLRGVVVSRTRHVTPALGVSIAEIDRSAARFDRQAYAAVGAALRRHWARDPLPERR